MATKGMVEFRANGEDYTVNDPNIAEEFDSTKTYHIHDHVYYQGDLYVFIAEHAAGAWNTSHVLLFKVGAELANLWNANDTEATLRAAADNDLKSAMSIVIEDTNAESQSVNGFYYYDSDLNQISFSGSGSVNLKRVTIAVEPGQQYAISATSSSSGSARVWAFTAANTGSVTPIEIEDANVGTLTNKILTVPANAEYLAVNYMISGGLKLYKINLIDKLQEEVDDLSDQINYIEALNNAIIQDMNAEAQSYNGYFYYNSSLNQLSITGSGSVNLKRLIIEVEYGEQYFISATSSSADSARLWAFIPTNVGSVTPVSIANADIGTLTNKVLTVPKGAHYLAISYLISGGIKLYKFKVMEEQTKEFEERISDIESKFQYDNIYLPAIAPKNDVIINSVEYDRGTVYTLSEIYAGYDALVTAFPDYVSKEDLGVDSSGDYHIYRYDFKPKDVTIYNAASVSEKKFDENTFPVVYLESGVHASEYPCMRALLNAMTLICNAADEENDLGWLRNNVRFVVVPVLNPWGYVNETRYNCNHVNINRNYNVPQWSNGSSDPTSGDYRGESPASEKETQYSQAILDELSGKITTVLYYSFHTHGAFQDYKNMTSFAIGISRGRELQKIGIELVKDITVSGWKNHELPQNSGYIGIVEYMNYYAMSCVYGSKVGIPSVCPECMYRYWDGTGDTDYSHKLNCINAEYILKAVVLGIKRLMYID